MDEYEEFLNNSEHPVDPKLKSKIFLRLGKNLLQQEKQIEKNVNLIEKNLKNAITNNPDCPRAWHYFGLFNLESIKIIKKA
jgi:hypothetical protein